MIAQRKRHIEKGAQFDHLFPKALGGFEKVRTKVTVPQTVEYIQKRARDTMRQTAAFAQKIRTETLRGTLSAIWHFLYLHVDYEKDEQGKEQVKDPARLWADRKGDCDCYTNFISSTLLNLGIPHKLRTTAYGHRDYHQHIYVIVPDKSHPKGYWTVDVVTDRFDHEVPYTDKTDYDMDLYALNGIPGTVRPSASNPIELAKANKNRMDNLRAAAAKAAAMNRGAAMPSPFAQRLQAAHQKAAAAQAAAAQAAAPKNPAMPSTPLARMLKARARAFNGLEGRQRKTILGKGLQKIGNEAKTVAKKVGDTIGKGVRFLNRFVNAGTIAVRNGVLLLLKLDFLNSAQRLRWGYLPKAQAVAAGIKPEAYDKIAKGLKRLNTMYWQMGGKRDNLRKGILEGNGNKDRKVPTTVAANIEEENPNELFKLSNGTTFQLSEDREKGGWKVLVNGRHSGGLSQMTQEGDAMFGRNAQKKYYTWTPTTNRWAEIPRNQVPPAIADFLDVDLQLSDTPLPVSNLEGLGYYPGVVEFRGELTEADILGGEMGGLGVEPTTTAAASAAGSGVIAAIVKMLPELGQMASGMVNDPKLSNLLNLASGAAAGAQGGNGKEVLENLKKQGEDALKTGLKAAGADAVNQLINQVATGQKVDAKGLIERAGQLTTLSTISTFNQNAAPKQQLPAAIQQAIAPTQAAAWKPNDTETRALFQGWKQWYDTNKDRSDIKGLTFHQAVFRKTNSGFTVIEKANPSNQKGDYRSRYTAFHNHSQTPIQADMRRLGFEDYSAAVSQSIVESIASLAPNMVEAIKKAEAEKERLRAAQALMDKKYNRPAANPSSAMVAPTRQLVEPQPANVPLFSNYNDQDAAGKEIFDAVIAVHVYAYLLQKPYGMSFSTAYLKGAIDFDHEKVSGKIPFMQEVESMMRSSGAQKLLDPYNPSPVNQDAGQKFHDNVMRQSMTPAQLTGTHFDGRAQLEKFLKDKGFPVPPNETATTTTTTTTTATTTGGSNNNNNAPKTASMAKWGLAALAALAVGTVVMSGGDDKPNKKALTDGLSGTGRKKKVNALHFTMQDYKK